MTKRELNKKQEQFVQEYMIDLNATQAAIRAGYSKRTAYSQGQRLLKHVEVQRRLQAEQAKRAERVQVDQEYVLRRLVEIDQMDALDILDDDGSIKPIKDWPKTWRQFLSGFDVTQMSSAEDVETVVRRIRWPDKIRNLELLGRHLGMFTDRVEVDASDDLVGAILNARKRTS